MSKLEIGVVMKSLDGSNRTRVLCWLYLAIGVTGVGLVLALVISLGGNLIAGWQNAPVDEILPWLVRAALTLVVLRLALAWSIRIDQRNSA